MCIMTKHLDALNHFNFQVILKLHPVQLSTHKIMLTIDLQRTHKQIINLISWSVVTVMSVERFKEFYLHLYCSADTVCAYMTWDMEQNHKTALHHLELECWKRSSTMKTLWKKTVFFSWFNLAVICSLFTNQSASYCLNAHGMCSHMRKFSQLHLIMNM